MRFSKLQKYILLKCFEKKNFIESKSEFYNFYKKQELKENKNSIQIRVHNSVENLVEKDLAAAYGYKTQKKWFIDKVRLTGKGKKKALELLKKRQRKLPIK
ncbi:hypothetical protein DRH27_01785 [Candidatus Falkowbacteria bacterium]|nr:MAG: hypothetical protein DRH27_01785 [Candidatus Falkowbacteria bacterium]